MAKCTIGLHLNSDCIGIKITRNQETAVPFPYPKNIVGTRHCRLLYIIPAQPELISFFYPEMHSPICTLTADDFKQILSQF